MEGGVLAGDPSAEDRGEGDETGESLSAALPLASEKARSVADAGGESDERNRSAVCSNEDHVYEGPDLFGTEAFDSVCCVDILDQAYKPAVRRILALWGLLLLASTSLLLVGFFGSFRFLHRDGSLDLSHNLWKEHLFWSSVVQFMVTALGIAFGFIALVSHTQLGSSCEVHSFQRFFTWCLLFHLAGALFCFVAAVKLTAVDVFSSPAFASPLSSSLLHRHTSSLGLDANTAAAFRSSRLSPDVTTPGASLRRSLALRKVELGRLSLGKNRFKAPASTAEPAASSLSSLSSPFALSPLSAKRPLVSFQFSPLGQNSDSSVFEPSGAAASPHRFDSIEESEGLGSNVKNFTYFQRSTEPGERPPFSNPRRLSVLSPSLSPSRSFNSFSPASFAEIVESDDWLRSKGSELKIPSRESPVYQKMLFSSVTVNYFEAVLHALCFVTTWRLAGRLGRLFGLKMPRIPF
ncbi:putative transmembrane protein [Toxoplasma gondii VAND]|uniref:Putative transmembrane protein n=1 Tax=Toxoplasma gondii VAND TaxID=933077 RepID=A0A086QII3_TOXGO|nr:putative transmembrane protein [Toxoplasma gondii VAND]